MATTRTYSDACGMSHALDLVGARWALHVVRELMLGPKRYGDLKADLAGISTNMLSDRLGELERSGLVRRRRLPRPAGVSVYELTPYGADLEPIITMLGRWALRSPLHRTDLPLTVTSFVLSLRTNFDADRGAGTTVTVALRIGDLDLDARVVDGSFTVEPGVPPDPDATLSGPLDVLAGLVYDGADLGDAVRAREVVADGDDDDALRRFLTLFTFPDKVDPGLSDR